MNALNKSRAYRVFVRDRNKALEKILQVNLRRIDRVIKSLHDGVLSIVDAAMASETLPGSVKMLEERISRLFMLAHLPVIDILRRQRASVYTLAYTGEAEAIGRGTGKKTVVDLPQSKLPSGELPGGGEMERRVEISIKRLEAKVLDAVRMGVVMQNSTKEMDERIRRAFPKEKRRKVVKKLKGPRLKEANKKKWVMPLGPRDGGSVSLTTGFIDDKAWSTMVSDYLGEEIPMYTFRGPEFFLLPDDMREPITPTYIWEIEKEVTQDFVDQVRKGQVDAARENGIKDFIWIAVIDDRTDDCCAWRDGLTTSEIKRELRGKHRNDECDAEVPPAHFNCRCDLAPVTDELIDQKPEGLGDFDTWLRN